MKIKQCDRCRKIIPNECKDEISTITYQAEKEKFVYPPFGIDLCHDCSKSFVKWLKALGNVD